MNRVPLQRKILNENDRVAAELRERFLHSDVLCVNLISSPGSGKTSLLEQTLGMFPSTTRVAVLTGDLQTENDAERLRRFGFPVKQITTGTLCHLEAAMVQNALQEWNLHELDFLFIENVGNLVCPSSYDLGENLRLVLMSVTEGEDKPLKYPTIFNSADVAVISKNELAATVEFDWETARAGIQSVRPGMRIFRLSAKTGEGMDEYLNFLSQQLAEQPTVAPL